MKEKLHEQISALVDDELAETEQILLIKQLESDVTLRHSLLRYQLISDSLQNHLPRKIDPDFSIGVQVALQDDPVVQAGPARLAGLFKPVAGLALAASVAVVAVLSLQSVRQESPSATSPVATAPVTDEFPDTDVTPLLATMPANSPANPPRGAQDLDVYLVNHNEYAVNRGMLPYVRLVGHDMNVNDKE
jgi:sigma-E factor negative regulatory protein RseA